VFRRQFETVGEHNCWESRKITAYLTVALQGRASDELHGVAKEATYEEILEALRGGALRGTCPYEAEDGDDRQVVKRSLRDKRNDTRETDGSRHAETIDFRETSGCWQTRGTPGYTLTHSHPTLNLITERADNSMIAEGWIVNKLLFVTIDTGSCMTVARPDIFEGNSKRKQSQCCWLTMAPGEYLPFFKEALV
jgi:hypothetical protein